MAVRTRKVRQWQNMAELLHRLGDVDPERVRIDPKGGFATEQDLLHLQEHDGILCELVDGVLLEKVMGFPESTLTIRLSAFLFNYLELHPIGSLGGTDGGIRLLPGLVRMPDISFFSYKTIGREEGISDAIAPLAPDIAVEVLSPSNRRGEMERKLREYFLAGVKRVWLVDKDRRTVTVYSMPENGIILTEDKILEEGELLPDFRLELSWLFAKVPRTPEKPARGKRKRNS